MLQVLKAQISHICEQFLNNIEVKGSRTDYSKAEALSGLQRFILEHIQNFDKVFCNLKKAGFTVAEMKS